MLSQCLIFFTTLLAWQVAHSSAKGSNPDDVKRFVDNLDEDGTVKIVWKDGARFVILYNINI